jgi:hypothetical protein
MYRQSCRKSLRRKAPNILQSEMQRMSQFIVKYGGDASGKRVFDRQQNPYKEN